jgi:hypothetical protein
VRQQAVAAYTAENQMAEGWASPVLSVHTETVCKANRAETSASMAERKDPMRAV